jgi:hypothetical protein
VRNVNVTSIHIDINRYKHRRHAVTIDKRSLYRVDNYRKIGITRVSDTSTLNNYRPAPVVNKGIVGNSGNSRQRYGVTDSIEIRKPHRKAIKKIGSDQMVKKRSNKITGKTTRKSVGNMRKSRVSDQAGIKPPEVKKSAVPANRVSRSGSQGKLGEGALKRRTGFRGENQKQVSGEVQKQRRKIPSRSFEKGTGRRENQGRARREVKKQRGKMASEPARRRALPKGEQVLRKRQPREQRGGMLPRSGQGFQKGGRGERSRGIPTRRGRRPLRAL